MVHPTGFLRVEVNNSVISERPQCLLNPYKYYRLLSLDDEKRVLQNYVGEREITYERNKKEKPEIKEEITRNIKVDNPHLKAMIILVIDSGMRCGEILKLRWQNIEFENSSIHILGTLDKTIYILLSDN